MSKAALRAEIVTLLAALPDSVTVTCGNASTPGAFDDADDMQTMTIDGVVKITRRTLRVAKNALPAAVRNATVTIDDGETVTSYTVREVSDDNDGLETVLQLVDAG